MKADAAVQTMSAPSPSTGSNFFLQRKCACGGPAGLSGTCEDCADKQLTGQPLQAKLVVGSADDPLEREADRVADQVLSKPAAFGMEAIAPRIQRSSRQPRLQAMVAPGSVDRVLASTGRPLEPALRLDMEQRFGHDFSRVRIHSGSAAEESARDIEAHAYTVRGDIVFGRDRFAPGTVEGRRLLAHELAHVIQQDGQPRVAQRTPSPAGEGSAQAGDANPPWHFGRMTEGRGFIMNPTFWRVTYHLSAGPGTEAISNDARRTAFENVQRFLASHPAWREGATVDPVEVTLAPGATAAAAAQDLIASGSRSRYSFECFTAAALVQFMGVYRGMQATDPTNADANFNSRYGDFRVAISDAGGPTVRMGGAALTFNLATRPEFSLRQLQDDSADMGLERGDWVYLSNRGFITSGAFQGENATYLGNKRFFGHGIGLFTIREYAQRLRRDHRVRLTEDEILDQVRVGPRYRAPASATAAPGAPAGSGPAGGASP
jgi:hypothetical protein